MDQLSNTADHAPMGERPEVTLHHEVESNILAPTTDGRDAPAPTKSLLTRMNFWSAPIAYLQEQTKLDRSAAERKDDRLGNLSRISHISLAQPDDEDDVVPLLQQSSDEDDDSGEFDFHAPTMGHGDSYSSVPSEARDNVRTTAHSPATTTVLGKMGTSVLSNKFADIVLADGTATGPALRAALRVQLLAQNTELHTASSSRAQDLLKKGPELLVHTLAEVTSGVLTTPILLASAGLDKLVGSFDDVKNTYDRYLVKFGADHKPAARIMQGLHFVAWVMKNAAVLVGAGLTMLVNSALFLIDKLVSGTIAVVINTTVAAGKFAVKHWKGLTGLTVVGAIVGGIAMALKAIIGSGIAVAAGAGFTAIAPYLGMGLGALLGLYLVVRGVRYVYENGWTIGRHDDKMLFKIEQNLNQKLNPFEVQTAMNQARLAGDNETQARLNVQDRHLREQFGSPNAVKYLGEGAQATAKRVISRGATHFAHGFGRDVMRTFSNWKKGADDVTITQRALAFMSDEELQAAVVDYTVDKSIGSENDRRAVKAALLASLRAQKAVAEHLYGTTLASDAEKADHHFKELSGDELQKHHAIAIMLAGSDKEILAAITKYAGRTSPTNDDDTIAETLGEADGDASATYSTFLTEAIETADIEAVENQVKVTREVEAMKKDAKSMFDALISSTSGFTAYLSHNDYVVRKTGDGKPVNLQTTGANGANGEVAFTLQLDAKKFDVDRFFGTAENVGFTAETTLEEVLPQERARRLVQAFRDYNNLGRIERLGYLRDAHRAAHAGAPTPRENASASGFVARSAEHTVRAQPSTEHTVRAQPSKEVVRLAREITENDTESYGLAIQLSENVLEELNRLEFALEKERLSSLVERGLKETVDLADAISQIVRAHAGDGAAQASEYDRIIEDLLNPVT